MAWLTPAARRAWSLIGGSVCAAMLAACAQPPTGAPGPQDRSARTAELTASPAGQRARLRLALATAYYQQGQHAVALDELRQALAADPDWVPALNLQGLAHLGLGQWSLAQASLQRALALAPQDPDTAHNLAWTLCQHPGARERHAESVSLFQRALAQPEYAQPARTWAALGVCQQRAGMPDLAEASLRQALALEPSNPALALLLAQTLFDRGRWQESRQWLDQAHAAQPASAQSLWLAVRLARKLDNLPWLRQMADQLRNEFGRSPQALALDKGLFDE